MNTIFSIDQLEEVAQKIIAEKPNKVILFHGEMGVGKTTLIKALRCVQTLAKRSHKRSVAKG